MKDRKCLPAGWVGLCCLAACGGISYAGDDDPVIDEKPLSQLIKQLRSENRGFQLRAAQSLAKAPAELCPKIVPSLIPLLKSERENDRFVAAQTLGNYGPAARAAVPELLPVLEGTQYERNRAAAAKALGQILKDAPPNEEVEKVADALIRKIDADYDKYSDVRREAVTALGMIGPAAKACIPKLVRAMTESKQFGSGQDQEYRLVRRATAWTCGRMGPLAAEHVDRLIAMMHSEGTVCPEVPEAIGCVGPVHDNVAPNLVDFLEKGASRDWRHHPDSKLAAWKALEKFGPKAAPAVPLIARFLRENRGTEEPPDLVIQWFAVLRAAGPAAKDALPQVQRYVDPKSVPGGWQEWAGTISPAAAKTAEALSGKK
jgi:hypothetical protein